MTDRVEIFCCYAHEDQPFLLKLRAHLAFLEREIPLEIWHDQDISPGTEWEEEINKHLNTAHIILLLISPDFIASDYCYSKEMKQAMERHESGEARVIPILLRPGVWQETPFAKLQVLPNNARAVTEWRNRDKALSAIAQGIEQVVKEHLSKLSSSQIQSMVSAARLHPKSRDGMLQRDWGEAPEVPIFFGRTKELILLDQWLTSDHCRLVAIVGMRGIGKTRLSVKLGRGGIGKTDLSLKLARGVEVQFDYVIWRRLLNAPKLPELLTDLIKFLSNQQEVTQPDAVSGQISRLLHYLRKSRCLIILDNAEMLLQGGKYVGQYIPGYEEYGQLFEQIAEIPHQSCLLLTSREKPPEIVRLESKTGFVRSLGVRGLNVADSKKIFAEIDTFSGSKEDWKQLNHIYNGNPLALELVARHVKEVFFGNISEFLREGEPIFTDLRNLLDWHFNRLSDSHREVMYWFAINREPTSFSELREDIISLIDRRQISSTLQSLQRLIPLEKSANNFTLQPVLIEYMTERFVEEIVEEVRNGEIHLFNTHTLLKASASDHVRDVQGRLILKSISEKLLEICGNRRRLEVRLNELLSLLRERFQFATGYAGGNLLNLLCYLQVDLRGYNFSSLPVWQAYLQGVNVQEANFAHADLTKSVFTDSFGSVICVAFSGNGGLLAAGTGTGEIRLWYTGNGTPSQTIQGHTDWVRSIVFGPDGKTIASSSDDQTVRLWDVSSGKCLKTLYGHTDRVWSTSFSPDGSILASGSWDYTVRLWDVSNGVCFNILQGHTNRVGTIAFNPDGSILASGSFDQTVRLWDVSSGMCLKTLHGHTQAIRSITFSPNDNAIISGSFDQTVRLWDVSSGMCLKTLHGHANWIYSVTFSPDGKIIASSSEDRTVRLWDTSSGQCIKTLQGYTNRVESVAFNPNGSILAGGYEDQTVRLWNVSSGRCLRTLQGHTKELMSVTFSPDGSILASGSADQTVRLWDANSGQCKAVLDHFSLVWSVVFSPDGSILASGSEDQIVRLWNTSSGQCIKTLQGHTKELLSVAFSPDGKTIASSGDDQTVRLWDANSGQCKAVLDHFSLVWSVVFSPDGKTIASGSEDRAVRLWDVFSGQCLKTLQGHTNRVGSVTFSPDGSILASGSEDQTVRLWDVNTSQCRTVLNHNHWVWSVSFSPRGEIIASGCYDGTISLWDPQTGQYLQTFRCERPYEGMNITQVKGLTEGQKAALWLLGATEDEE